MNTGNTQIVKLLLSVEAKNSITDSNGATPLLYAALNNHSVGSNFLVFPKIVKL